ncbi:FCD domain-containing protein [candidate division KSB1 bacterium]|nr:FCD domain-containing protein [candidate division KSB1 bacterium]
MDDKADAFIESLEQIEIRKPTELIIQQIKRQISTGVLKPGDKLPPERDLAKRLSVGRGYIREAIKKLEFYGILKTIPHKGTIVSSLGVKALEGLISNVLELERENFRSLVETRLILETNAARLTALRATDDEIDKIQKAHDEYRKLALKGTPNIEIDFLFHLSIAEFCKNQVLRSIISLITPDIISYSMSIAGDQQGYLKLSKFVIDEHLAIMNAILSREPEQASNAMSRHLTRILTLVTDIEKQKGEFDIIKWIENYKARLGSPIT